jgi:hypothetical protein
MKHLKKFNEAKISRSYIKYTDLSKKLKNLSFYWIKIKPSLIDKELDFDDMPGNNLLVGKGKEEEIITIAYWLSTDGKFVLNNISLDNAYYIQYTSDEVKYSVSAIGPEIGTVPSNFTEVEMDEIRRDDDEDDDEDEVVFVKSPTKRETITRDPSTGCLRCGGKGCIKCVKDYGRPWYDKILSPGDNWTTRNG